MLKVDNFLVRVLRPGDREGLHQALTVGPKPLVEFRTLGNHLISSYYVETLLEMHPGFGLLLEGSHPEWAVSGVGMDAVRQYIKETS